jgi:hypothetical protein
MKNTSRANNEVAAAVSQAVAEAQAYQQAAAEAGKSIDRPQEHPPRK